MDTLKALAILAFCAGANAAALPQVLAVDDAATAVIGPASASAAAAADIAIVKPVISASPPGLPLSKAPTIPKLSALPSLPLPTVDLPKLPKLSLPIPPAPKVSLPSTTPVVLPVPLPGLSTSGLPDPAAADALSKVVSLGSTVLHLVLAALAKGASFLPGPEGAVPISTVSAIATPVIALPGISAISTPDVAADVDFSAGVDLPSDSRLNKRQILPALPALPVLPRPSSSSSAVSGSSTPLPGALPGVGGLTGTAPTLPGGSDPLSGLAGSGVAGAIGGAIGGVTTPLTGSGAAGAVGSVPAVGGAAAPVPSPVNPNVSPLQLNGIPGTDPVGAFSISVIATLLSLLKKDPMSLFAPSLPIGSLVKRDLPELHRAGIPERAKRQFSGMPSLSNGISGVGIGSLPLSGVPGVPPDLAFLVGSIAKNIAIPGGSGLGSVTSNILATLNGVVPNFLFQLPVVQDSVPTFGVLQLLASINPNKFRDLAGLTSLASLQQATSGISAGDIAFIRTLPNSPDPTNLISTIMTLSDNILSLPGYVTNLKASVSVLCMKNLGLAVPGL